MRKIRYVVILLVLLLTLTVPSFANHTVKLQQNDENISIEEAIDAIKDDKSKEIVEALLETPIFVEIESDDFVFDEKKEIEKVTEYIEKISVLSPKELVDEISEQISKMNLVIAEKENIFYTTEGVELLKLYDIDTESIINLGLSSSEGTGMNIDAYSVNATKYPDRTRTKSETWVYKNIAGAKLIKGKLSITWTVKNNKITKIVPKYYAWTLEEMYKFSHIKAIKKQITNNGQRANYECTAYYSQVKTGAWKLHKPGVWVYNDGGCDFHLR